MTKEERIEFCKSEIENSQHNIKQFKRNLEIGYYKDEIEKSRADIGIKYNEYSIEIHQRELKLLEIPKRTIDNVVMSVENTMVALKQTSFKDKELEKRRLEAINEYNQFLEIWREINHE